ncbi:MAG: type II secretion system F family protein [Bacteroidetes bacterium]|nr:type II secretion system F family protein [Bacteroidota bacterium]
MMALLNKQLGSQNLKDNFKEYFYAELALLLDSGLNMKSALELLMEQEKKPQYQQLISELIIDLTAGAKFSQTLKVKRKFSAYEYFSVQIGEETGSLGQIFKGLSEYYAQRINQRRNFIGALTYPLVIFFTAILAISFMFLFMVPMFKEVFNRMGNELPWLTQKVIVLSENFSSLLLAFLLFAILLFLIHLRFKKTESYQNQLGLIILRIPFLGPMMLRNYSLRMLQSLRLLLESKIPLTQALELCSQMITFYPLQKALLEARDSVLKGASFHEGIKFNKLFSSKLIGLVKVGEETNQMAKLLGKLCDQTEKEIEHQSKVLGNIIEPLIIVFLGAFVAIILISMYLPMFQLSSAY